MLWDATVESEIVDGVTKASFKARFIVEGPPMSTEAIEHFEARQSTLWSFCDQMVGWYDRSPWFKATRIQESGYHWKTALEVEVGISASDLHPLVDLTVQSDPSVWSREPNDSVSLIDKLYLTSADNRGDVTNDDSDAETTEQEYWASSPSEAQSSPSESQSPGSEGLNES